jgi:putative membrane protein
MSSSTADLGPGLRWLVFAISVVVFAAVAVVLYALPRAGTPEAPGVLPSVNALLNGAASMCLLAGYAFIRRRKIAAHRACMVAALGFSSLFLVGYLAHHANVGSVPFQGTGVLRTVYFAILIPHVLLAAPVVPLALFTLIRGFRSQLPQHRKIARITLPIWLYVSLSGVVIYWMLYHLGR